MVQKAIFFFSFYGNYVLKNVTKSAVMTIKLCSMVRQCEAIDIDNRHWISLTESDGDEKRMEGSVARREKR